MNRFTTLLFSGILVMLSICALASNTDMYMAQLRSGKHVIITPQEFLSEATQLSDFYMDHMQIERLVVDQQDIFNQYNAGNPSSEAIREYLCDHFDDPGIWPYSSVLLFGSGTQDWGVPHIKNRIIATDFSDDDFVQLDDDTIPDVAIGRFPAQTFDQIERMVNRNILYITNPFRGFWRNKMLIAADDEYKNWELEGLSYTSGLNHTARSQDLMDSLMCSVQVDQVLGIEYPMTPTGRKPAAKQAIINGLNQGQLVWHYIGHAATIFLGDEHYFDTVSDLGLLQNESFLPFFGAASANVGQFDSIEFDCMAEQLLTHDTGGAIASLAARSSSQAIENNLLFLEFYSGIINQYKNIGISLLEAKHKTFTNAYQYNTLKFNLLGDPLLFVVPPDRNDNLAIEGNPVTLSYGDNVALNGILPSEDFDECTIKAYESSYVCNYSNTFGCNTYEIQYRKFGNAYHEETIPVADSLYEFSFQVEYGIHVGNDARIISYSLGDSSDFVQYVYPIEIDDNAYSPDTPSVQSPSLSNHPNPFNPTTEICFSLTSEQYEQDEPVAIEIFNVKGQKVRTLPLYTNELSSQPSGARGDISSSITWDGTDSDNRHVASGLYFYQLKVGSKSVAQKKMMLLK